MSKSLILRRVTRSLTGLTAALLAFSFAACGEDGTGIASESVLPPDTASVPLDSTAIPVDTIAIPLDSLSSDSLSADSLPSDSLPSDSPPPDSGMAEAAMSSAPGIAFGSFNLDVSLLGGMHTGTLRGGGLMPDNILSLLSAVRARGGRAVIKFCMGKDSYVKDGNGNFSLTKWKSLIDRYRRVNLGPYINDGTIVGHFLIDEPHRAVRWGGRPISQATVEEMARYSKSIWPGMTTFVRVVPSWLASAPVKYVYLDAGWAQYQAGKGDVTKYITTEVAAAKRLGLGLAVGLNILDGGNGSSKLRGTLPGAYAMSATELKTYGSILLEQSYSCAFYMWTHNSTYYNRSDVKSVMTALSLKARSHARTSCRQ